MAEKAKSRNKPASNPVTGYFRETVAELKKVTWPTWREARQLTLLVIAVMFVVGVILFAADLGASGLLRLLLNL